MDCDADESESGDLLATDTAETDSEGRLAAGSEDESDAGIDEFDAEDPNEAVEVEEDIALVDGDQQEEGNDEGGDEMYADDGDTDEDDDDGLGSWQLLVFQRPGEGITRLEIFSASSAGFEHLLVLNLQQNAIHDISPILATAHTLRALNVSQNEIAKLPGTEFWSRFRCLTLCFLAHNRIQHWRDMDGLQACGATLLWLSVHGNPIAMLANARPFLVNKLSFLRALDDFVVTDCEFMKTHGTSTRFGTMAPHMNVLSLHMPLEFVDDNFALAYLRDTEAKILHLHADNSPSIVAQRVVRGFLSRSRKLPRVARICELITRVQKCARGFLLRRLIAQSFIELVCAQGQQHLLMVTSTDSPLLPSRARDGLKRLVVHVQEWKRRFHLKKQAIAIKKIRFWCQMAFQRYQNKSRRLLREEQEVFVYYTAPFEKELLAIAEKAAHRDPFLMAMPPEDREQFIRDRCGRSGVSVLRIPHQSTCQLHIDNPMVRPRRTHFNHQLEQSDCRKPSGRGSHRLAALAAPGAVSAIVRVFSCDLSLENQLLVTEKQFLQRDLKRIAKLTREHQLAVHDVEPVAGDHAKHQPRAVLVHLAQLSLELEKRLVICNRKILHACIKHQHQQVNASPRFTLARVQIRPRGHYPARWESKKIKQLAVSDRNRRQQQPEPYEKMRVLIPWSIDMYLQIMSVLDRTLESSCSPAFALSYEQTRKISAALSIQSAWRASQRQSKRDSLEVAISRALLCIQRWWRFRTGLRRRLDFVSACLRLCGTITSRTLFMEESAFRAVSDAACWVAVRGAMRTCREHSLHCRMVDGKVEVVLSPSALLLRSHSQTARGLDLSSSGHSASSFRAVSIQRCGAYLPVWLPGTPEHSEVSMTSRDEDATPLLLTERVQVEPTVLERELMVGLNQHAGSSSRVDDSDSTDHIFQSFAMCRHVAETSARVVELSRRLSYKTKQHWQLQPSVIALDSTSFVRLTFESVDEARKRALVLLSKTFDPVTRTYARLYSIEALFSTALRHHQWALGQVATAEETESVLEDCAQWLRASFPSPWWSFVHGRLDPSVLPTDPLPSQVPIPPTPTRPDSAPHFRRHVVAEARATSSPSSTMIPRPPPPLHVTVPGVSSENGSSALTTPAPAAPPASCRASSDELEGCSRHQMLRDRMGKPRYESVEAMREQQLEDREYRVRDLREERERAMEALIVDRRMIQREHAAEIAGIQLDIDVKLQKLRYQREVDKLHVRELVEFEKFTSKRSKLTRHFEKSFAAQTGAMMRRAAREAVARKQEQREDARKELVASVKRSSADALERRQDAKSYWFVSNQKAKTDVARQHIGGLEHAEETTHLRRVKIRKRIKEDKEIKAMLRLM